MTQRRRISTFLLVSPEKASVRDAFETPASAITRSLMRYNDLGKTGNGLIGLANNLGYDHTNLYTEATRHIAGRDRESSVLLAAWC